MNVIFDNIIFSLQRSGGVSKVWYELLKRAAIDTSFSKLYLEFSHQNIFRQHLELPIAETVYPSQRPFIERYLTPQIRTPFPTTIFTQLFSHFTSKRCAEHYHYTRFYL